MSYTMVAVCIILALLFAIWRLNRKPTSVSVKQNRIRKSSPNKTKRVDIQSKVNQFEEPLADYKKEPTPDNFVKVIPTVPDDFHDFKLLKYEALDSDKKQLIEDILKNFKKPHPLLLPLTQSSFEPSELFELIKSDAEMTAKVLNVVNSAQFALQQPITNINHAIAFLGITQVKNIAMQCAITNEVTFPDETQDLAFKKLWQASYLASMLSLYFSKSMGESDPAELSTRCLLSYLGDLAILAYKPDMAPFYADDFSLYERTKIIQGNMGINSAIVGKCLAQQWNLPQSIESAIENSLIMLTNEVDVEGFTETDFQQNLLCYLSCRTGDLVTYRDVKDISLVEKISFKAIGHIEFYYIEENLKKSPELEKVNSIVADPLFKKKINKMIEDFTAS